MKELMKVILSNWINLVVIFIAVYVAGFISAIVKDKFGVGEAFLGTAYSVILYGFMFWTGFIICMLVLDGVLFSIYKEPQYTKYKLVIEWVIISIPFIYWLIKYNQWIFLVAVLAFLLGQYLRKPHILKILQ